MLELRKSDKYNTSARRSFRTLRRFRERQNDFPYSLFCLRNLTLRKIRFNESPISPALMKLKSVRFNLRPYKIYL